MAIPTRGSRGAYSKGKIQGSIRTVAADHKYTGRKIEAFDYALGCAWGGDSLGDA